MHPAHPLRPSLVEEPERDGTGRNSAVVHLPRPHLYVLVEGRLRSSQSSGLLPRREPPLFSARECPAFVCCPLLWEERRVR